jgi:hypothetical protein
MRSVIAHFSTPSHLLVSQVIDCSSDKRGAMEETMTNHSTVPIRTSPTPNWRKEQAYLFQVGTNVCFNDSIPWDSRRLTCIRFARY